MDMEDLKKQTSLLNDWEVQLSQLVSSLTVAVSEFKQAVVDQIASEKRVQKAEMSRKKQEESKQKARGSKVRAGSIEVDSAGSPISSMHGARCHDYHLHQGLGLQHANQDR
jgi:hypothetical protein